MDDIVYKINRQVFEEADKQIWTPLWNQGRSLARGEAMDKISSQLGEQINRQIMYEVRRHIRNKIIRETYTLPYRK